jgi:hypothetical protein
MPGNTPQKDALDKVIKKSRVHFYKPIQIAEILYHHRTKGDFDLSDLEAYRNISKVWRDEVSIELVGRKCTSSAKFQDNLFESNAIPSDVLNSLGEINIDKKGLIEAYIYHHISKKMNSLKIIHDYIKDSKRENFSLKELVLKFESDTGLKRSIDKVYEILVYALFSTLIRTLKAKITLDLDNKDESILKDFGHFIELVLGLKIGQKKLEFPASIFRIGTTNAADRGVDMISNFGVVVQVKHLSLTLGLAEDIVEDLTVDKIVIVCLDSEKEVIESILMQVGLKNKLQGIITCSDLDDWYCLCLKDKFKDTLGLNLLKDLEREFVREFPSRDKLKPFLIKRGYDKFKNFENW